MSDNSVSLATAQAEITNWKDYCEDKGLNDRVKAHNIPLDSIVPLLSIEGITSIRAYMGLADKNTMAGMHLYFVAVDGEGNDIIEVDEKSVILELTTPCPATCDVNSPLNI
jgi:hypothetical protein